tara:strand:+ start:1021 stop:1650 length:630 start_codon:yes stop_codon:yes gene_type:complete
MLTLTSNVDSIAEDSCNILNEKFEGGMGLTSTPLKAYSGPALEEWSELTIKLIIAELQKKYPDAVLEWGKGYIDSDLKGFGQERLDQHVKVNGKYAYLQEDRAWVDKPFYTLKRAVIRNIMISCASQLSKNVKFGLIAYSIDIKQDLINTCDYTQDYGERIRNFSLTGRPRNKKVNGKTVNWFETGFVEETVVEYIKYVYQTLEEEILA